MRLLKLSKILPILDYIRILDLISKIKTKNTLLIIMYHEIGDRNVYWDKGIPTKYFEDQIIYLSKLGFEMVSLCEALELLQEGNKIPSKIAVLTFDDGYKGVYYEAFPIMKKYNIRGTLFITAGFVEYKRPPWSSLIGYALSRIREPAEINILGKTVEIKNDEDKQDLLRALITILPKLKFEDLEILSKTLCEEISEESSELYERLMLTREEIKELAEHGFEIGGHGYWHLGLPYLSDEILNNEVQGSMTFVRKYSNNCNVRTFAYPYGIYSTKVFEKLEESGFSAAVTATPHLNKLSSIKMFELGRVSPYRFGMLRLSSFKYQLIV